MKFLPSTRTIQEHSAFPAEVSALHLYWPSSSGRALSMVREHRPPATQHSIIHYHTTQLYLWICMETLMQWIVCQMKQELVSNDLSEVRGWFVLVSSHGSVLHRNVLMLC